MRPRTLHLAILSFVGVSFAGPACAGPVDFQRDVRPLLSRHCFKCHGPDDKARKAKLRLDVREDAGRLGIALGGILAGLGIDSAFERQDDATRAALLLRLLAEEPPKPSDIAVAAGAR